MTRYRFKFRQAIRLECQTKAEAIATAKSKGHEVRANTKNNTLVQLGGGETTGGDARGSSMSRRTTFEIVTSI
jgi:hypothetical protein